jgi:hypothetical protein
MGLRVDAIDFSPTASECAFDIIDQTFDSIASPLTSTAPHAASMDLRPDAIDSRSADRPLFSGVSDFLQDASDWRSYVTESLTDDHSPFSGVSDFF